MSAVALLDAPGARHPVLFGITGPVGVGKSTTAAIVQREVQSLGFEARVLNTDGFLLPNVELTRLGLTMRKGFPETFDHDLIARVLRRIRAGNEDVRVPVYSHVVYDREPGPGATFEPAPVVIVEGVNVLQPPVVDALDFSVYVDADEDDLIAWFVGRFLQFCADAEADEATPSFYRQFCAMDEDERRNLAASTWEHINAVNLRKHIAPSRARATYVLYKNADHSVRDLRRFRG